MASVTATKVADVETKVAEAEPEAAVSDTVAQTAEPVAEAIKPVAEVIKRAVEANAPVAEAVKAETLAVPAPVAAPAAGTVIEAGYAQFGATMEKTMEQVTKTTEGLFKAAEEAAEFSRGNLEAVAKATQVYVAGVQDLGKQTLALVQGLTDHTVAGAKALGTVKSLKEAADIQATYARAALEKSFTETAKLQEAALKLAEASFAPISARMTLAVEKLSKPLAA